MPLAAGLECVHVCVCVCVCACVCSCACVLLRVYVQFDIGTKVE
jgi:hypothetical protein